MIHRVIIDRSSIFFNQLHHHIVHILWIHCPWKWVHLPIHHRIHLLLLNIHIYHQQWKTCPRHRHHMQMEFGLHHLNNRFDNKQQQQQQETFQIYLLNDLHQFNRVSMVKVLLWERSNWRQCDIDLDEHLSDYNQHSYAPRIQTRPNYSPSYGSLSVVYSIKLLFYFSEFLPPADRNLDEIDDKGSRMPTNIQPYRPSRSSDLKLHLYHSSLISFRFIRTHDRWSVKYDVQSKFFLFISTKFFFKFIFRLLPLWVST